MSTLLLPIHAGRGNSRNVAAHARVLDDVFGRCLFWLKWSLTGMGYPRARIERGGQTVEVHLHQLVYEHYHGPLPAGLVIDHEDRNPLNALPTNLRAVTQSVNTANSGKADRNRSGYKGVSWHRVAKKWRARIMKAGRESNLGYFDNEQEAAGAVNREHRRLFPGVEIPNPPVEPPDFPE